MFEESKKGDGIERRSQTDRRKENRGFWNAPFFRIFLNRRKNQDRRSGKNQRE